MITSRDRVIRSLTHQPLDRAPRDLWMSPGIRMLVSDEAAEMTYRYPNDFVRPDFQYPRGQRARGRPYELGEYTDAWGVCWKVLNRGTKGEIIRRPLAGEAAIADYQPPWELLDGVHLNRVSGSCAAASQFVLAWTETSPFRRLGLLRGADAAIADLENDDKEIRQLLARLHEFSCREMAMWASSDVDGVAFADEFASQADLLIPAAEWRDLVKPLYQEYCQILHEKDKFVFFHCPGNIGQVFSDLVEVGVDAINCELFSMNIEALAKHFRGKIAFWGTVHPEQVLTSGKPEDIHAAVHRVRRALDFGSGGLIAQCAWKPQMPFKNVAAALEAWLEPILAHA